MAPVFIVVASWIIISGFFGLETPISIIILAFIGIFSVYLSTVVITSLSSSPVEMICSIIDYASHDNRDQQQPEINDLKFGRELITAQSLQVYDLASSMTKSTDVAEKDLSHVASQILDSVPTPLFGVDTNMIVTLVNKSGAIYIGKSQSDIIGKPLYDCLNLSFQSDETYSDWLSKVKTTTVTANKTWTRVRHKITEDTSKQFDLVASFSSNNQSGTESTLAIFDKTEEYTNDDQDVSFVALAVHELRTPLTLMRGYIEVFEDELGPTLNPELTEFMHKMQVSAQQLGAFVSNILNVARIDENQLVLKLRKEDWKEIINEAVGSLNLRAQVHGKHIDLQIADDLPPVASDRVSAHEVINNLVDNAIKYSGNSEKILVTSQLNSDGLVETSIQDFGIGIPESVMTNLFQKYHRSHKSSSQVGGTGLGLFLCKALVNAHGGNIWVRSKEGEGSIFTFTLIPFDQVSAEQVEGEDGIIRGAHGWIKNHSLYRN